MKYISQFKNPAVYLALFILICFIGHAYADKIKLKNGREINGVLKEVNETDVVLQLGAGTTWFHKSQVESINDLSIEEAGARLNTVDAFIQQDKNQALSASAQEGQNFVAKIRKLEFKSKPLLEIVSKDRLKENLNQMIARHNSEEDLDKEAKLLKKLGLLASTGDYKKEVMGLLTEEVAGYYDPEEKIIYVSEAALNEILPGMPSITIMHEQVHALQDQYHDLKKIQEALLSENDDKSLAVMSVIEGDATVLMYDGFFRSMKGFGLSAKNEGPADIRSFVIDSMIAYSKRLKGGSKQPAIFMEAFLFPYVWGGSFIQYAVNNKGWEEVDAIFSDMPASSEQVMHPEKYYIAKDAPMEIAPVDLSGFLGASYTLLAKNTLGEMSFYLIGKAFLDELEAKLMSEGWGGDYYELYEEPNSKKLLLICLSKWDSEKDAEEFFSLYKKIVAKKYKQAGLIKEEENSSLWKTEEELVYIARTDNSVVIIEGAPEQLMPGLTGAFKG